MASQDSPEVLQLVHEGRSLVEAIAKRLTLLYRNADKEEFVADGNIGLLKAARQFCEVGAEVAFRTFAKPYVENAMIDGHRARAPLPRRIHEKLNPPTEQLQDAAAAAESERRVRKHVAAIATAQVDGVLARLGIDTQGGTIAISQKTSAEAASLRNELKRLIASCIDQLPENEAYIVRRHYIEEQPIDGIAKELGLAESTTRDLHSRARDRMKKRLAHLR